VPVRKLWSLAEAEESLWHEPGSALLWATVTQLWRLSDRLFPRRFPPGLYRHRTIEDANRLVEDWEAAAIAHREPAATATSASAAPSDAKPR
jgi:hypothetical protein